MLEKDNESITTYDSNQKYLYQIPPKHGRYIVLDVETTGWKKEDHVIEIGAHELKNGALTGDEFHVLIKSRVFMDAKALALHGITDEKNLIYKEVYINDRDNLNNFIKWVGDSKIFAHNACFDMEKINQELIYFNLEPLSKERYRCSMRIFREIIGKMDPLYDTKFFKLEECCSYFGIKINKKKLHHALNDSHITATLVAKIYQTIDNNPKLYYEYDYNCNEDSFSHYYAYIKQKSDNHKHNDYFNPYFIQPKKNYLPPFLKNKNVNNIKNEQSNEGKKIQGKGNNKVNASNSKKNENDSHEIINQIFKDLDSGNI